MTGRAGILFKGRQTIRIQTVTRPLFSGISKYGVDKTFFGEGRLFLSIILSLVILFTTAGEAKAGLFSGFWKFLLYDNSIEAAAPFIDPSMAAVSLPLLGSQGQPASVSSGVGGPIVEEREPLSVTQDGAVLAPLNPLGTIADDRKDQILVYTVREGDIPGSIADRFGISLNTLLWANGLSNPKLIRVGDDLVILPVSGVKYEIKKGDTLDTIAKKFKGDVGDILSFNGLAVDEPLVVGSTLIIPDGEIASPVPVRGSRVSGLPDFQGYYLRPILGGRKSRGIHGYNGVDLASSCGLPVLASAAGTIIVAKSSGWNGGYGRYIVMSHPNGTQTLYAHLSSLLGKIGQTVAQGSQIAAIGSTGNSTGCHVHFEIRGAKNPF